MAIRAPAVEAHRAGPTQRAWDGPAVARAAVVGMAVLWAAEYAWLALQRHLAGGSHAEDLGFTDQVLANFLRGQWFRMSIYQGATWNTEIDVSRIARPDSLLAFHFEPMLLLLVPPYLVGGISLLLVIQAVAVAAGALPAYALGRHFARSPVGGVAVAAIYLLSPLGQWAVLADFHTSTLAAPLLLLAVERLLVRKSTWQALAAAGLAATAREDVGLIIATLGAVLLLRRSVRQAGLGFIGLGLGASILGAVVIRSYSGGGLPFDVRYADTIARGLGPSLATLERPVLLGYAQTLLASGGWLGLFAPLALMPALPSLALNALSSSPWMAAGKAHYSGLVLPFVVLAAAAGLRHARAKPRLSHFLSAGLVLSGGLGYALDGSGPPGGNYAPASITTHALHAATLAESLPAEAAVSASSALVPRLSRRAHLYIFPAVLDADYVFVDLQASPSPTSAGDVFLRTQALVAQGGWQVQSADDGLLLLQRAPDAPPATIPPMLTDSAPPVTLTDTARSADGARSADTAGAIASASEPIGGYADGRVSLLSADLMPSPDGAVDVDGPRWILRTTWRAEQPLPATTHLEFWLSLRDGQQMHVWDIAPLWWHPPGQWTPGEPVTIDVPDVPIRQFVSWQARFSDTLSTGSNVSTTNSPRMGERAQSRGRATELNRVAADL